MIQVTSHVNIQYTSEILSSKTMNGGYTIVVHFQLEAILYNTLSIKNLFHGPTCGRKLFCILGVVAFSY